MSKQQILKYLGAGALLFVAIAVVSWALLRSDEEPLVLSKATLKGRVTYKNKPVASAMIIVAADTGNSVAGTGISDSNGNYFVTFSPVGTVKIGINTDAGKAMMRGASMAAAISGDKSAMPVTSDVPQKYFSPETSGITATLNNVDAENEFNIDLK